MLSACCISGYLHRGMPSGKIRSIMGTSVYYAVPANSSTTFGIIIFSDLKGHRYANTQLIADELARNGYFVVVPDLFHGDAVPGDFPKDYQVMDWLKNHLSPTIDPVVDLVLQGMRGSAKCKRIGGIGYCYGAKFVVKYLKAGKLDAGFVAHPTMTYPEEMMGIERPLSLALASNDSNLTKDKRRELEDALEQVSVPWQLCVFSGVRHGFAVRCNPDEPVEMNAKEHAFTQAVQWLDCYIRAAHIREEKQQRG